MQTATPLITTTDALADPILFQATNPEDGLEAYVVAGHMGFHVILRDLDADESVGFIKGFAVFSSATGYATDVAFGVAPAGSGPVTVPV